MADLRQVVLRQSGHFHDGIAGDTVFQHGTGNFEFTFLFAFIAAFFNTALLTELNPLLNALLFKLPVMPA